MKMIVDFHLKIPSLYHIHIRYLHGTMIQTGTMRISFFDLTKHISQPTASFSWFQEF